MAKPKEEIQEKRYIKDIHFFYELLSVFKSVDEVKLFTRDILTRSELRMIKKRWHIVNLLDEGLDIRTIARRTKAGTQTIIKMKQLFEDGEGGLRLGLEKIREIEKKKQSIKRDGSKYVKKWLP